MAKAKTTAASPASTVKAKTTKAAQKTAETIEEAVIDDMAPPTRAHAKATKEQFEAADAAARRAVSGF